MRLSAARVLWLLTGALGAVIAIELLAPSESESNIPSRLGPVESAAAIAAAEPIKAWTAVIGARPLFNPNRRPEASAMSGAVVSSLAEPPRLTGILTTLGDARAIFAGTAEERSVVVLKGMKIGSWQILEIDAEKVIISGPDGERMIRPRFANGGSAPLPPVDRPQPKAATLLPPLPQVDIKPFRSLKQPSGASIFTNAALPPPNRTPH